MGQRYRKMEDRQGAKPPAVGRFFVIFWNKKAILMPLNHILQVFRAI